MLKVSLVGCGRIAKRHAELLGQGQISGAELVAVCDINESRARSIGEAFGVPWYRDMQSMMKDVDTDLVTVLTPSGMHADHVCALSSYKKAIVVEKPMALRLQDADRMIRSCDEHKVKLFVIKQNRFNVPIMKAREALEQGRFDKLVMGAVRVRWSRSQAYYDQDAWRGTWAYDGGVLANQASHHVDMLEWMMGDVESVFAKASTALANIEAEDTAIAVLKFQNGALGVIEATTATRPKDLEGSISILGESGTVEVGGFAMNEMKVWQFSPEQAGDDEVFEKYSVNPPDVYGFGHKAYYDHVVDCMLNDRQSLVDGLEGRKSLELISAIYESIETGKEVFLHFKPHKCKLGIS